MKDIGAKNRYDLEIPDHSRVCYTSHMQKITPFIWLEQGAKEAADFYISIFSGDSKIVKSNIMTGTPSGTVEIISVHMLGQEFTLMSAGPFRKINEANSFVINCETQDEVDHYWESLSAVKESEQCGWLKDKYGVSWQVIPTALTKLLGDADKAKAGRVQEAMMQMKKIVIADLEKAYKG